MKYVQLPIDLFYEVLEYLIDKKEKKFENAFYQKMLKQEQHIKYGMKLKEQRKRENLD